MLTRNIPLKLQKYDKRSNFDTIVVAVCTDTTDNTGPRLHTNRVQDPVSAHDSHTALTAVVWFYL